MKKLISFAVAGMFALSLAACGSKQCSCKHHGKLCRKHGSIHR